MNRIVSAVSSGHTSHSLLVRHRRHLAAAAAGASGALGAHVYIPPTKQPGGDSVFIRVIGQINGVPFDIFREFDYSDLKFSNLPAENPAYIERLRKVMDEIADEIVTKLEGGAA